MLNRVCLTGRLVRAPDLHTTTTGKNVVEFTIAVNKKFKPQDGSPDADFFRIKAWGQTAEYVAQYIDKGRLVAVDGRLETRKFTDNAGNSREIIEVVADSVYGLDRPKEANGATTPPTSQEDQYDPFEGDE